MWLLLSIIFSRCPAIFNGICTSWFKKQILLAIRILRESSKFLELQFISSFHPISKMDSIFDDVSWCHIFWPRNHWVFFIIIVPDNAETLSQTALSSCSLPYPIASAFWLRDDSAQLDSNSQNFPHLSTKYGHMELNYLNRFRSTVLSIKY